MPPAWLTVLSWAALAVALASAGWITCDIYVRGYRQQMKIMEATLGDIIAESAVFGLGASAGGLVLGAEYIGDYVADVGLGIVFQYFAIAPMRGLSLRKGLTKAAKADVASLTAFEVDLFGWMALMYFVLFPSPHLHPDSPVYWS